MHLVAVPEYHRARVKPSTLAEMHELLAAKDGPVGCWEILGRRPLRHHSDEIVNRYWLKNTLLDIGATALWKNSLCASIPSGGTVAAFNVIHITTSGGSTTLQGALTSGQTSVTSLTVAALPASIAANAKITVSYGTANAETFTVTGAGAAAPATSIPVVSQTSANAHSVNDNIVVQAAASDNPSSLSGTNQNSGALGSGAFTYSGSGAGNRQVQIIATFAAGSTAGNYTEGWLANSTTPATGIWAVHVYFPPATVNSTTSQQVTLIEKV